jgi:adenine-specific DNA-methyltransferase
MRKPKFETPDLTSENIEKIAALFPNCVTEMLDEERSTPEKKVYKRAVNFELLKQMLSPDVVDGDEAYEFTWVGKKAAIVEANKPIRKTLRPCMAESKDWDTTENLYIEGDNLEVLKLLQESYLGKVKMIYIDPPYNTGNDFIYADDFRMSGEEWSVESGEWSEDGDRLFKNTDTNGRFHSDWCSMIYSRLMLARNLLTDDGVIFISIDDNEVDNLRKICSEVFGATNFIATYLKQSKVGGGSDSKFVVKEHEYCLVYAKNINLTAEMFIEHNEEYLKRYKEIDEKGRFFWDTFARPGLKNPIHYDIIAPDGTVLNYGWIHGKERFEQEQKEGIVRIVKKKDGSWSVQFKQYLNLSGKKPRSMTMDFGGSIEGKNEVGSVFESEKTFSYPKSTKFIKTLLSTIDCKDSLILDFFSGSATTAHAVMQLNAEDGGHRKFIMVQLPEKCDEKSEAYKAGYKNICEIGKERIRRAGEKILKEQLANNNSTLNSPNSKLDIGFRVLKLDSTNMKDVYYAPCDYDQGFLPQMESNIKDDRTDLDLLFGCLIDWGLPLSLPYKSEQLGGCTVHTYNDGDLIACFDANIPESVVKEIAKRKPLRAVFRDSGFASSPEKINMFEIFKLYMPEDAGDISKRVRVI